MKREAVLKAITKELGIGRENAELLAEFIKENKELQEFEFYEKLKKTFPWFELTFKYNNASNLNKIERHLYFFKILAIILMVIGAISLIAFLSQ
jgi:hypothetical protein